MAVESGENVVSLPAPGSPCGQGEMCRPSLSDGLSGFRTGFCSNDCPAAGRESGVHHSADERVNE